MNVATASSRRLTTLYRPAIGSTLPRFRRNSSLAEKGLGA